MSERHTKSHCWFQLEIKFADLYTFFLVYGVVFNEGKRIGRLQRYKHLFLVNPTTEISINELL